MKIALPPFTSNTEFNLVKQKHIIEMCYSPEHDIIVPAQLDCPSIWEVHSIDLVNRAYDLDISGFGGVDRRKVIHAEASCSTLIAAVQAVLENTEDPSQVCFAPVSGFHHAGYNFSGGYCTFNGLMAACAWAFKRYHGSLNRVLVLDGDGHYGNGTVDIIAKLGWTNKVVNWAIGAQGHPGSNDWESRFVDSVADYDLVLYQAGADAHIDDPYGAGHLGAGDWYARDRLIFEACERNCVPIVWNLAGGYNGGKTLNLHASTFITACEVFYPHVDRPPIPNGLTRVPEAPSHQPLDPETA